MIKDILKLLGNETEVARQTGIALSAIKRIKAGKVKPQTKTIGKLDTWLKQIKVKIDEYLAECKCGEKGEYDEHTKEYQCYGCMEETNWHCEECKKRTPHELARQDHSGETYCGYCSNSSYLS